jgi:hypothetical protein
MSSALQKALAGEAVSDTAAPKALKEAAERLNSLKERVSEMKGNASATAKAAIHFGEATVTAGVAGFAEGYRGGRDRMKIGPVPVRAAGAILIGGWGLGSILNGGDGGHQLAVATGLAASESHSLGQSAGQALREKRATANNGNGNANGSSGAGNGGGNAATPTPEQQALLNATPGAKLVNGQVVDANGKVIGADDMADLARMIRMTPGTAGEPAGAKRTGLVRAKVRARA